MKKIKILMITLLGVLILSPASVNAQKVDLFKDVCKGSAANSAVCKDSKAGKSGNPIYGPQGIITIIINTITIVVGVAAVIGIIMAGFKFMTSGSNPQEVTKAREMVLYAIVALAIAALAQVIVRFFILKVLD